jgi:hypothetical protein
MEPSGSAASSDDVTRQYPLSLVSLYVMRPVLFDKRPRDSADYSVEQKHQENLELPMRSIVEQ